MTINGAKKILNNKDSFKLDENLNPSIKTDILKYKLKNISKIVKHLKDIK